MMHCPTWLIQRYTKDTDQDTEERTTVVSIQEQSHGTIYNNMIEVFSQRGTMVLCPLLAGGITTPEPDNSHDSFERRESKLGCCQC